MSVFATKDSAMLVLAKRLSTGNVRVEWEHDDWKFIADMSPGTFEKLFVRIGAL